MNPLRTIAILGGSGSGKTTLSLEIARKFPCVILSLDSLSIYTEINIASAKPSLKERGEIPHFGLDVLSPREPQNVQNFITEYHKARQYSLTNQKHLLIVGGSGFYLKTLLSGLSPFLTLTPEQKHSLSLKIKNLGDLPAQYDFLAQRDNAHAKTLKQTDKYRITRALEIYFSTQMIPSVYFKKNPPKPLLEHCEIVEILLEKEILKENIKQRTKNMIEQGLLQEVESLSLKYGTAHQWAKSIGIKETLEFLNNQSSKNPTQSLKELCDSITLHTIQLAKRQKTFNKTQFPPHLRGTILEVKESLKRLLS